MASPQAIFKFIQSLRPYISKGLISIEDVYIHLNKKGVEVTDIVRKAVNNAFKKQPAKDPIFDKTKIDLPIDEAGKPFNPNHPLKEYGIPVTIEGKKTTKSAEDIVDWLKKASDKRKYSDDFYSGKAQKDALLGEWFPGGKMGKKGQDIMKEGIEGIEKVSRVGDTQYITLQELITNKNFKMEDARALGERLIKRQVGEKMSDAQRGDVLKLLDGILGRTKQAEGGSSGLNYLMGL